MIHTPKLFCFLCKMLKSEITFLFRTSSLNNSGMQSLNSFFVKHNSIHDEQWSHRLGLHQPNHFWQQLSCAYSDFSPLLFNWAAVFNLACTHHCGRLKIGICTVTTPVEFGQSHLWLVFEVMQGWILVDWEMSKGIKNKLAIVSNWNSTTDMEVYNI